MNKQILKRLIKFCEWLCDSVEDPITLEDLLYEAVFHNVITEEESDIITSAYQIKLNNCTDKELQLQLSNLKHD